MKSMEEQIINKCIHFNGVMNKCCKAGVNYADVRIDKPYKFPCLNQGGECELRIFPTPEELQEEIVETQAHVIKSLAAYAKIKEHFNKTKAYAGTVSCECGGSLRYTCATVNGHIWARCDTCGISFNE